MPAITIQRAKRSIDIAVFRLNRKEIETASARRFSAGVRAKLIAHTNRGSEGRRFKLEERPFALGVMVS